MVTISNSSVAENLLAVAVFGTLNTAHPNDPGNVFSFTLISGTGSTDNGAFTLDPDGTLKTAAIFEVAAAPVATESLQSTCSRTPNYSWSVVLGAVSHISHANPLNSITSNDPVAASERRRLTHEAVGQNSSATVPVNNQNKQPISEKADFLDSLLSLDPGFVIEHAGQVMRPVTG